MDEFTYFEKNTDYFDDPLDRDEDWSGVISQEEEYKIWASAAGNDLDDMIDLQE